MVKAGLETDHLVGLPRQYIRALAKTHPAFDAILGAFYDRKTPEEVLDEIDNVLW